MSELRVPGRPPFFEPASGAAILGVDWLCFGLEWQLGPVSLFVMSLFAFSASYAAVSRIQLRAGDPPRIARAKGFLGGAAAGIPFPVAGTIVGALILLLSGLKRR